MKLLYFLNIHAYIIEFEILRTDTIINLFYSNSFIFVFLMLVLDLRISICLMYSKVKWSQIRMYIDRSVYIVTNVYILDYVCVYIYF